MNWIPGQAMLLQNSFKDRERDILKLMSEGMTNRQIGKQLYLARETVRWYNKQIYSKLGVHNRTHAVTRARELGLLESDNFIVEIMVPPVQYVKNDDVYIAYQTVGEGQLDVVYISGFISHLESEWEQPRCARAYNRIASYARLITIDKRGVGLSDRIPDDPGYDKTADDIRAVLEAVDSKGAIIITSCDGTPAACLLAVKYPDLVKGIVIINGVVKGSRSSEFPWALPFHLYDRIFENVEQEWGGPYGLECFVPDADDEFRLWWAKFLRQAASPGVALRSVKTLRDVDITSILPEITVPTLVMHSRQNMVSRVESGRYIADHISSARYVELPGNSHIWWWEAEPYLDEIEIFVEAIYDELI